LIIERLGLRNQARVAWERYLDADSTSEWASEAREHLGRLPPVTSFLVVVDRDYKRLVSNAHAVTALVRRDPQAARARSEMELLGRWGRAFAADDPEAAVLLRVIRGFGAEITRMNGDRMLDRAVAAIDSADAATRSVLASAHADYDAGLRAFQQNRPVDGEQLLRRAAGRFERGGSPMALNARYFAANTAFEQGRRDEAQRDIEALLVSVPAHFPALRAQLLWQRGVCHAVRAEWGDAIEALQLSTSAFEQLGETANAGSTHGTLAYSYDRIGDSENAWRHRMTALRGVASQPNQMPLKKALAAIALDAVIARKWHTAASFLHLEIEIARGGSDDLQLSQALLSRAAVHHQLGDRSRAAADLAEADAAIARLKDPVFANYLRHERLVVGAMLTSSPAEAIALLTDAIAFHSEKGERTNLPGLFLQRARAARRGGDAVSAAADLERGIAELESHRESLPVGVTRWGAFHTDEELFEEAIDLAIDRNDVGAAFNTAEKARARSLLDSYKRAPSVDHRQIPADTVIVEYSALPSRLIIFTADAAGVRALATRGDRQALAERATALTTALQHNKTIDANRVARELHELLIQPVAQQLQAAKTIVFIPDASIATVPFGALVNARGEYLLEHHTPLVSPSAATFGAAVARRSQAHIPREVLVVANAEPDAGSARLAFVAREADRVARAYRKAIVLQNDEAQLDAIAMRALKADVIHFAGHAIGDDSGLQPATIVLRQDGRERRIDAATLATLRLRRTSVVVLAGCSTARGGRRASEGVISVAHGFLTAGAPSVIATLWPIDDQLAARFFPRLHEQLAQGLSPAEALRVVQLEAIHRGDIPASLWAAVQDIGS
jgi:CHAT domain-containing protein